MNAREMQIYKHDTIASQQMGKLLYFDGNLIREGFKKKEKKGMDLSNAHLTPASQA